MLGLGWPQWITIIALIVGLLVTFKVMARASIAYERARRRREQQGMGQSAEAQQVREGEQP
jgi:CHASE1-domain containing sensor protein